MPVSPYYKGMVKTPNPDDPVNVQQIGRDTYMDFGVSPDANIPAAQTYGRSMGARRPVTQSEIGADALMRAQLGVPDIPLDLLQFGTPQQIPAMPPSLKAKPAENAVSNRGGSGGAGRGKGAGQFGASQFDMPGLEPLEMTQAELNDKSWELDPNTAKDVAPGTSLEVKPEQNVVDKEPDLQTPQGLYQALAKKYPDILTQNLDQLQESRVTREDTDALADRAGLGSLFIAASKAASGAGSVGGKTAESIAPTIVNREDTLARQRLKDRMDVASENMAMNAKAVDLAMKQIGFADEREQYDPNSDVSQFARQFMKDEFDVQVPANVPAYQLKQFLPAIMQKYQTKERIAYQNALLGERTTQQEKRTQIEKDKLDAINERARLDRESREKIAKQRLDARPAPKAPKPEKMLGSVPADVAKVEMDLAKQFRADKTVQAHQLMQNEIRQLESLAKDNTPSSDQALITKFAKILDPGSVVRETEFAITERGGGLITGLQNTLDKARGVGRLQPAQRAQMLEAARSLTAGVSEEYKKKRKEYADQGALYGARPEAIVGVEQQAPVAPVPQGGGLAPDKKARLEELRKKLRGGQ